ncbi:MAG TPA: NifB/NifX family molybdenum-iron cluster-binding protein [Myxococcota bacterium]|nr:NifB/NifX family molybdenum-iron cluster-binding protein [Myxococcota bacterium]HOD07239.1 NifB/NifX family molybdenum-iron cluster-binding protein [Myxococcota bacterium]HPB50650.1 NifB/NifX family molybdenum-iron cluster-binding protein [Myxococcota bacterium]HQP95466.1 NifB/NifX family molybdenum-iron cluster-binding protein [Myxococcota bacterium]
MKIAIATTDGNVLAREADRAPGFVLYEIEGGTARRLEYRRNRRSPRSVVAAIKPRDISNTLSDCSVVVAGSIGAHARDFLENTGIEVVVTSEWLVDRAAALFALTALMDDSRVDPEDLEAYPRDIDVSDDGFDA